MARMQVVILAVVASACLRGPGPQPPAPGSAAARLPVLLVAEGTAIDRGTAAELARVLSAQIGRPVVTAAEAATDESAERARLVERYGRLPAGGWDEARCATGRAATHALQYDADAYYHLHLDRTETTREATSRERAGVSDTRHASATILGRLGLASAGSVREARLTGELTVTTFGPAPETRRLPLRATAHEVDPIGGVELDPRGVVTDAIERLAPPPWPHWDSTARRQLAAGCRVAALAIYDARLRARAGSEDVMRAALGRRPARPAGRRAPVAPSPAPSTIDPSPPDTRYTCRALCELHMVELCNNDRDLWSRHQRLWESTPCGQRRPESFLRDCYQRQWLSGTFDEACIAPCEQAPDGRARLLHFLQGGGCAPRTSSL